MKIGKHKSKSGGVWQVLKLSRYEAGVLANSAEDLQKMSDGKYQGTCIGGANIEIKVIKNKS